MSYAARWEKLKKDFETDAGKPRPQLKVKVGFLGSFAKASGITPVMKEVDAALQKKQRAPLAQAINKFMKVREEYTNLVSKESFKMDDIEVQKVYSTFLQGIAKITVDVQEDLKKLQETKVPGKVAVALLEIEGDMTGTIAKAKKDLAKFSTLEKKHSVVAKADAALKDTQKYTKASARTAYKEAWEALESFKKNAKKCSDDLDKVLSAEKSSADFTKAVTSFRDAMKAFATVTRVDQQIQKLKDAEKASTVG